MNITLKEKVFDYTYWENLLPRLVNQYKEANPFPHIVLDNFLNPEILEEALKEFPGLDPQNWINYQHYNENKYGKNKIESFPETIKTIFGELNSERFVRFISTLSGISNLQVDWTLEGGGLHQSKRGGYLNMHADFTAHPHNLKWQRRINLLVYLNKDWQESYKGHLELWDKEMKKCIKKVLPVFNRAVIFNTDEDSFHGHPHPLNCPEEVTRKSFALYYFTEHKFPVKAVSTNYQALPGDSVIKRSLIELDKSILRTYDVFKRIFKFDDKFISKVLRVISSLKRK